MKKVIFTLIGLLALGNAAFSQWSTDSVVMGPGSANDIFYSLKNGIVKTENNKNWHLAFALGGASDSAAVWANHNAGNAFVRVYNIHKDFSQWASVTLADTATASFGFNNDQGWDQGALNMNGSSSTQYGWGSYNSVSHDVEGDSIYIIKANGVFYKFFINSLVGTGPNAGNWNIQVDTFSGATMYDTIKKTNYPNSHFAYYDLATAVDSNREPATLTWDVVFTRYSTKDPLAGSNPVSNNVIGVLRNKGVKATRVSMIPVDSSFNKYWNYVNPWGVDSAIISSIGWNWKVLTSVAPPTYFIPDSNSYFVKDVPGNLYQLQFLSFSGSSTGITHFRKRLVEPTAVNDINSMIQQYELFPNPAQNELHITLDSKASAEAQLIVTSITGQVVLNSFIKINSGLNAYNVATSNLSNGNYIISIKGKNINLNNKITISK